MGNEAVPSVLSSFDMLSLLQPTTAAGHGERIRSDCNSTLALVGLSNNVG